jgi:ribose 1,5-bisphosphokinase
MLVLVVGPSGAGKDTLIKAAKVALADDPRFVFPRRAVTRPAVASIEDHESLSMSEFALREANGAYALSWEAHGLRYGLPEHISGEIAAGKIVVMNGSRAMIAAAQAKFPGTIVVLVEATIEARASRLVRRGRESEAEVSGRLAREVTVAIPDAVRIDNSGSLDEGTRLFLSALRALPAH